MPIHYLVRQREILSGREYWLKDGSGEPMIFCDRLAADLAAMISSRRSPETYYSYVAEIDTSFERILR